MKFTKMSLVAALLIGSSAFAIENVKVSGDAKLYYNTNDAQAGVTTALAPSKDAGMFSAQNSAGQAALGLGITADLTKNVSTGVHTTVLSTLGLQGQLVNNVWEGTNGLTDSWIVDEAWIAGTVGNTTGKIGRMALDTPLVFSENWSIIANTFEAAVVINQDIPDTTLVGAYVGGSNGLSNASGHSLGAPAVGITNRVQATGNAGGLGTSQSTFSQFYNGAYAAGVVNNSWKPLTAQAWYYDAPQYVNAYWLQADLDASSLDVQGVTAGAQYTKINYNKSLNLPIAANSSNDAYAFKLGYEMKDVVALSVAYSQTGKETKSNLELGAGQNLATLGNNAQSQLYTEAWWNYGYVTRADTSAWNVTVTGKAAGIDLGAYYTQTNQGNNDNTIVGKDMKDFTATAGKDFGPLNATLAYIYTKADDQNIKVGDTKGSAYNTIQAYLTLNF